jgi:hypothetical protein
MMLICADLTPVKRLRQSAASAPYRGRLSYPAGAGFSSAGLPRLRQTSGKGPGNLSQAQKLPGPFPEVFIGVAAEKPYSGDFCL